MIGAMNMILSNLLSYKGRRLSSHTDVEEDGPKWKVTLGVELPDSPFTALLDSLVIPLVRSLSYITQEPVECNDYALDLTTEIMQLIGTMIREPKFTHHFIPIYPQLLMNVGFVLLLPTPEELENFEFDAKDYVGAHIDSIEGRECPCRRN
jgi:hypothetical protein